MKNPSFYFLAVFAILVASCSAVDEQLEQNLTKDGAETHILSCADALKLASEKLDRPISRGLAVNYDYVASKTDKSHPVAYIINYPNGEGWAVVSADDRVQEVLAYSETGRFSKENQACKEIFLDRIEDYLTQAVAEGVSGVEINANDPIRLVPYQDSIVPKVVTNYNQSSPYNYYFQDENILTHEPRKGPAGCGPVAVATVLTHIMDFWVYDKHEYYFDAIRSLYAGSYLLEGYGSASSGTFNPPPTNLDGAKGHVARLLRSLADEMGCYAKYDTIHVSGAIKGTGNPKARSTPMNSFPKFFKDHGFNCSDWNNINSDLEILNLIETGNIMIIYGSGADGAHVWVCSGAKYWVVLAGSRLVKTSIELHYDWGWGGSCNGYFSGKVVSPSYTFTISKYLSVKCITN